jgi:hypothetical protein
MADNSTFRWETCAENGCLGVQLPSSDRCWVHAGPTEFNATRERLSDGGTFDGRGVTFPAELLRLLLATTPHDDEGRPVVSGALLERATFEGNAGFAGATFEGNAEFAGATFEGNASFAGTTFKGNASFVWATFDSNAGFDGATFDGNASFGGAIFKSRGGFKRATFRGEAGFDEARFRSSALFTDATFEGDALFSETNFSEQTSFERATFRSEAAFHESKFMSVTAFRDATFEGDTLFPKVNFKRHTHFTEVTVGGQARFDEATFTGPADFSGTTFEGPTHFSEAKFAESASFEQVTFEQDADFQIVTFKVAVLFDRASFERARHLGPMLVRESLGLDGALFRERIRIEVSAAALSCQRSRFLAGVQLRVRWAQVVLDDADLAAPSVLSGANAFPGLDEGDWQRVPGSPWPVDPYGTPQLLSVRGADVAGLTVGAVDLQACRFVDAHHLDQLRAEGSTFPSTPRGWRWTKRRTIAEEHQWRASENHQGWYGSENQPPGWLALKELTRGQGGLLVPGEIAPIYRDLRKGLEDKKDEPGAADFYYGEMEMRRHSKRQDVHLERTLRFRNGGFGVSAAAECAILSLYWLVSGYGLRAWRALTSLTAVVLVASVIFAFWGFAAPGQPAFRPVDVDSEGTLVYEPQQVDQPTGWDELPTAIRYSAQATTALLRGPDVRALTAVGEWTQIALRLIGPVLLGLAVLSVRGRVKR